MTCKNKKRGLLYKKNKSKKMQVGGAFTSSSFSYDSGNKYTDSTLFGSQSGNNFLKKSQVSYGDTPRIVGRNGADMFKKYTVPKPVEMGLATQPTSTIKPAGYSFGASSVLSSVPQMNKNLNLGAQSVYDTANPPPSTLSKLGDKVNKNAGAVAVGGQILDMAGSALQSISDGKDYTYTKKEKFGTVSGGALKGVATGASMGTMVMPGVGTVVGAAAGLVVGLISGIFKGKKKKKEAREVQAAMDIKEQSVVSATNRQENALRDSLLVGGPSKTSSTSNVAEGAYPGYQSYKKGGSFYFKLKQGEKTRAVNNIPILKKGGKVKSTENIIPNGVLHEEHNKLGDKGMPVVKCRDNKCEKKYEIERDEMIFTLDTTKKIENLVKGGDLKKLGLFVKKQVLENTHSFTDKYNELNNYEKKNESIYA